MKTGVLGGTFDPPHLAHLVLAASARHALGLDHVLFVPAGLPWRKADREITPAALRVEMVRAAIRGLAWAELSALEVEREGPSYAVDTMRLLAEGGGDWWFILGADALADLPNWHQPQSMVQVARLAVTQRAPSDFVIPSEVMQCIPDIRQRIDAVPMVGLDISSSDLRGRIRDGRPTDVLLPDGVRTVADAAGLYRA